MASAIRTPNSQILGIQRVLDKKASGDLPDSQIQDPNRYIHPLPAFVLEDYFYTTGEEQNLLYGDLMGTRLNITDLKRIHRACRGEPLPRFESSFGVKKHACAYFGVMADILAWCGYKGWVILIDEVELIGRLGQVGRMNAYQNLNWLLNWSGTMPYPIYTLGVVASSLRNDVWFSSDNNQRAKNDRSQIPELASQKFGQEEKAEMDNFFDTAIGKQCFTTKPLSQRERSNLLESLVKLRRIAYAWDAQLDIHKLIQHIGVQPVRTDIRAALEALDINYVYKEILIPEASNLVEGSVEEEEEYFKENEQDS